MPCSCIEAVCSHVPHGSYDEDWTLRKGLRRFVWHDRIHGRAMWRMACALCGSRRVADPYRFA